MKYVYVCILYIESLCCIAEINPTMCINYTSIKYIKKKKSRALSFNEGHL